MTLKTFACDSIAEKNDFVNHFFPSQEIKKRGELCKHFLLKKLKRAFIGHASLTWIFVWGFFFLFYHSDVSWISIW